MFWSNWKTTAGGFAAIFGALAHLAAGAAAGDWSSVVPDLSIIAAGLTGLFAKDAA